MFTLAWNRLIRNQIKTSRPVHFKKLYYNKNELKFLFSYFGASEGFTKVFKAFINPFEVPQSSVKIKI